VRAPSSRLGKSDPPGRRIAVQPEEIVMSRIGARLVALALCVAGCQQSHALPSTPDIPAVGEEISLEVGSAGASLELAGVQVTIPPGALSTTTRITLRATDAPVPTWLVPFSPVLRLEPAGLSFAEPIELRIPFTGDAGLASAFSSTRDGGALVSRTTRIEGQVAIVESSQLLEVVVASACEGEGCCGRANGILDVALMVDSSASMAEEQAALAAQLPRFARALASGDVDEDGVQDFPALESIRLGVVSSDMGSGGFWVPTCANGTFGSDLGDDGILRTSAGDDLAGCAAHYPAFAEIGADSDPAAHDAFVAHVGCVATVGTGGCGFEQQLEAVLKAITPSTAPMTFHAGTTGHADGANAGFLRDDSILALVLLTDEDDCSLSDPTLVDPASPEYGGTDLNLRCHQYPEAAHSAERFVEGFLALRESPADLIYAAIAGAPVEAIEAAPDLDALLASTAMLEEIDPEMPTRLRPSCSHPDVGTAFPPRRIVTVARDLDDAGASGIVASICQTDFTPVVGTILERVASRARGECR
jgi:hypothetical protein